MTRKYYQVRQEMYDKRPTNKFKSKKSFFKSIRSKEPKYLIIISIILVTLCGLLISSLLLKDVLLTFIFMGALYFETLLLPFLQNTESEAKLFKQQCKEYVLEVKNILDDYEINDYNMPILKSECETRLRKREKKIERTNSEIFQIFFATPIVAIITTSISENSDNSLLKIFLIFCIGTAISFVIAINRAIEYRSVEYNKDLYLLDAINELAYENKSKNKNIQLSLRHRFKRRAKRLRG